MTNTDERIIFSASVFLSIILIVSHTMLFISWSHESSWKLSSIRSGSSHRDVRDRTMTIYNRSCDLICPAKSQERPEYHQNPRFPAMPPAYGRMQHPTFTQNGRKLCWTDPAQIVSRAWYLLPGSIKTYCRKLWRKSRRSFPCIHYLRNTSGIYAIRAASVFRLSNYVFHKYG